MKLNDPVGKTAIPPIGFCNYIFKKNHIDKKIKIIITNYIKKINFLNYSLIH